MKSTVFITAVNAKVAVRLKGGTILSTVYCVVIRTINVACPRVFDEIQED